MAAPVVHFATGAGVFTPEGLSAAYRQFGESLNPATLRAAKASGRFVRGIAVDRFTKRGVGHGIFGANNKGAFKLIQAQASIKGDLVAVELQLKGFAALQEKGGQTKPHVIRAMFGHFSELARRHAGTRKGEKFARAAKRSRKFRLLAIPLGGLASGQFSAFGANLIFREEVHHPGSRIKRIPFAADSFLAAQAQIKALWEREITKFRSGGFAIIESGKVA
jgi:hypothetical protein